MRSSRHITLNTTRDENVDRIGNPTYLASYFRESALFWSCVGLLILLLSVVGITLSVDLAFAASGRPALSGDLASRLWADYSVDPVDVVALKPLSTAVIEEVIREQERERGPSSGTPEPAAPTSTRPAPATHTPPPPPTQPEKATRTPANTATPAAPATHTAGASPTGTANATHIPTRTPRDTATPTDTPPPPTRTSRPTNTPVPPPTNTPVPPPTNTPVPPPTNTPKPYQPPPTRRPTAYPLGAKGTPDGRGSPAALVTLGGVLASALVLARLEGSRH